MSVLVSGVTRFFGEQKALDDVSFEVRSGEIVGFLGPNGAGKSTMMKIITGYLPASAGSVVINGKVAAADDPAIRSVIGYLPENNPLYPDMYVREYLRFAASFYNIRRKKAVEEIILATGLRPEAHKKIGSLSKGYRQRVGLAQALIHSPEILILDEATSGLDPNQIVEIRSLIKEAGRNKTVLFSTHIMQEVEAVCSRVIIIDRGRIVADKPKEEIYSMIGNRRQTVMVEFDREPVEKELRNIEGITSVTRSKPNTWEIESSGEKDIRPAVFSFAVSRNLTVLSMQRREESLEEIFRQLTS